MAQPLAGRVAIVTGGSRGIGAAIVNRLARDGADIAFSYARSKERADQLAADVEKLGRRAFAYQADQGDPEQVQAFIRDAHATLGRIDIVVNSAGIFVTGIVGHPDVDLDDVERQLNVNLKGVVTAVRTAVPIMADGGRIVSIGTTGVVRVGFPGAGDYVATKAAVAAYSRGWARDLGPRNITVNMIHPGAINTEMNPQDAPHAQAMKDLTALGRYGHPEEIAAAVAFLAGPDAAYITGTALIVDGGQTA